MGRLGEEMSWDGIGEWRRARGGEGLETVGGDGCETGTATEEEIKKPTANIDASLALEYNNNLFEATPPVINHIRLVYAGVRWCTLVYVEVKRIKGTKKLIVFRDDY